ELYSKKTIELFSLEYSDEDKAKLKKQKEIQYSFNVSEDWENIGVLKQDKEISFIYAQNSYETTTTKMGETLFPKELWDNIGKIANTQANIDFGKLLYLNAKVVSPKRRIMKLSVNEEQNLFTVSYDNDYVDENGKKTSNSDANRKALGEIVPKLPLSDKTKKIINTSLTQGKNQVITKKALDEISFLGNDNILVIPTVQKIDLANQQTTEHSERLTSEMYNQKASEIEKAAKTEYEKNGTFTNFFQNNPQHNTKDNQISLIEANNINAEKLSFHAYIVIVRDAKQFEKPTSTDGKLGNKVLDLLSVDFDYDNNEMIIKNSNYSGESQNVIIHKILELSK
ncbi:MAG: hypothetical protein HUJ68_01510, partial [Clostridia bacterium]|nr:hypothetical protein [Clostridia bacterium]